MASSGDDELAEREAGDVLGLVATGQMVRYNVEAVIAVGGMGGVAAVVDRSLQRRSAMKRIRPGLQSDRPSVEMFIREARILGGLQHPNVVPVHDLGLDADGHLYFTMKLVEGRTVKRWIADTPPGAIEHATLLDLLEVVIRVCDALAYAHSRGILHCDVKPSNVMVGEFGQVYLMDWGVARMVDDEVARAAEGDPSKDRVTGTPTYMSPEQAFGIPLDVRADVFAVGAFLYEIVTRHPPYEARKYSDVVHLAQRAEIRPVAEVAGEGVVPPALVAIIERAMAPDREARYPTIVALRDALVRFMRGGDTFPCRSYEAGEDIVREGEPGDAAFILESGRCEVWRTIDGVREPLREMGPGEVFGETAILSPGARTATVTAIEPTVVRVVTAETLEAEVASMKPWMGRFVRTLAARFRDREAGDGGRDT